MNEVSLLASVSHYKSLFGIMPSRYQVALWQFIEHGTGDGIVDAVAGSGKTFSLVKAAQLVSGSAVFVAFNVTIAKELGERLRGTRMTARTIHSIGYGMVAQEVSGELDVQEGKYRTLVREEVEAHCQSAAHLALLREQIRAVQNGQADAITIPNQSELVRGVKSLVDKVRVTLTDPTSEDALLACANKFGIDIYLPLLPKVAKVLKRGEQLAQALRQIDYTDMIYLPHIWRLRPRRTFPFVFVDECQDLGACQLDLVLKLRGPGGRMIFIGDKRQAIYGFAGADAESFDNIQRLTQATVLPLSVCYRCPTSHLDLARKIVPQIEPRPNAPRGLVEQIAADEVAGLVREGDIIISRLTAPMITLCITLIAKKKQARVKGRDIGKMLCDMVDQVADLSGFDFRHFFAFLQRFADIQLKNLEQQYRGDEVPESAITTVRDRCAGLSACYEGFGYLARHAGAERGLLLPGSTVEDFKAEISGLFADERTAIWLMTVHKAKGLEAPRVFLWSADRMPWAFAGQQDWEREQEDNLFYVALTRAKVDDHDPATGHLFLVVEQAERVPALAEVPLPFRPDRLWLEPPPASYGLPGALADDDVDELLGQAVRRAVAG